LRSDIPLFRRNDKNIKKRPSAATVISFFLNFCGTYDGFEAKKERGTEVRAFFTEISPFYSRRRRRNNKADIPIAKRPMEVGSGTTEAPAFHGVVAGKSGTVPDTNAPALANVFQDTKSLHPTTVVPSAAKSFTKKLKVLFTESVESYATTPYVSSSLLIRPLCDVAASSQ
jgi:hypothetical protein